MTNIRKLALLALAAAVAAACSAEAFAHPRIGDGPGLAARLNVV
jgi:hypothetical protein